MAKTRERREGRNQNSKQKIASSQGLNIRPKPLGFMQPLTQFYDQRLEIASNFLLNTYKPPWRSNSLFDSGPLRVDPTLDKDIPVEIQ
jgi:hypothetical protein